jgi:hypothetical protein
MKEKSFTKALNIPADFESSKKWFNFKIPKPSYIKVDSVDEYFSLSKKEREWCGLYRKPWALPSELFNFNDEKGWGFFYDEIKKQYPIQYFFREWLISTDNPLVFAFKRYIQWPIRELRYSVRLFFNPCFPRWRKVLPRHKYSDITEMVTESNFALICDFYHEEVINGFVDWESHDNHKKFYDELVTNVTWIEVERIKIDKLAEEALSKAVKNKIKTNGEFDFHATYEDHDRLEKHKSEKETEILKWFIENREFFWT